MPTYTKDNQIALNIAMDRDLHKQAKIRAIQEGITLTALITIAVTEYCRKGQEK